MREDLPRRGNSGEHLPRVAGLLADGRGERELADADDPLCGSEVEQPALRRIPCGDIPAVKRMVRLGAPPLTGLTGVPSSLGLALIMVSTVNGSLSLYIYIYQSAARFDIYIYIYQIAALSLSG